MRTIRIDTRNTPRRCWTTTTSVLRVVSIVVVIATFAIDPIQSFSISPVLVPVPVPVPARFLSVYQRGSKRGGGGGGCVYMTATITPTTVTTTATTLLEEGEHSGSSSDYVVFDASNKMVENDDDDDILTTLLGSRHRKDLFLEHWEQQQNPKSTTTKIHPVQYWEKKAHPDDTTMKTRIATTASLPQAKTKTNTTESSLPMFQCPMEDMYDTNPYITLRSRGSREFLNKTTLPTFAAFSEYIQSGGSAVTCIINPPNSNDEKEEAHCDATTVARVVSPPPLSRMKTQVEALLQCETSVNVYHSGPRAVALNRHYDSYDVLVVQLEGMKDWEVAIPHDYYSSNDELEEEDIVNEASWSSLEDAPATWANLTMAPGDALYLPQGVWHAATTTEGFESSTHVTIGLLPAMTVV